MNTDQLPEAISAASLVLAVLAALYTLWLPSVTAALAIVPDPDPDNRGGQKPQVTAAILTKALPLAAASLAATVILWARFFQILAEVRRHQAAWQYDDVKALMALTYVLIALLTVVAVVQLGRLIWLRYLLDAEES